MTTLAFTFRNHSGREAIGLRAMFPPSRTRILEHRVSGLPQEAGAAELEVNPRAAEVRWERPIGPGAEVTLALDYLGEPVELEAFAWRGTDGALRPPGETPTEETELLVGAGSIEELAAWALEKDALRCPLAAEIPDARRRKFHEFFCEFDNATNRSLMMNLKLSVKERGERAAVIFMTGEVLKRRVLRRAVWARSGSGTAEPPDLPSFEDYAIERTAIEKVSILQLDMFRRHFPTPGNEIDVGLFWDALEMFANGELKVEHTKGEWKDWDAEPQGAFAFFFAEFAFMADDEGIHRDRWRSLMKPLLAIQEVYTAAYRPGVDAGDILFEDYKRKNWSEEDMLTEDEKTALRQWYGPLADGDLRVQAGRNALKAFPLGE